MMILIPFTRHVSLFDTNMPYYVTNLIYSSIIKTTTICGMYQCFFFLKFHLILEGYKLDLIMVLTIDFRMIPTLHPLIQ